MNEVQIIVLAAGRGVRMESNEPKALTMLRGKPFLQHILETIEGLALPRKPVIVVGHKKERIRETLGEGYIYTEQKELLGTGHAVMSAKNTVYPESKIIFVISADQPLVSRETILRVLNRHLAAKPVITLATAKLPDFKDWRVGLENFGRIVRDQNGNLKNIIEFKDANEEERELTEVNPAIYAFDSAWLWQNIDKLKNENSQKEYYLTDLLKLASEQGQKIETVELENLFEALQPNSKQELELLEKLVVQS